MIREPVDETLRALLDYELAVDEWDRPPRLIALFDRGQMLPLPVPPMVWEHPTHVALSFIAEVTRRSPLSPPDPMSGFLGLALVSEGWMLSVDADDDEAAEYVAYAETHSIADHPAGVEVKSVYAVSVDGTDRMVVAERGKGVVSDSGPLGPDELGGRMADALRGVLDAMVGWATRA